MNAPSADLQTWIGREEVQTASLDAHPILAMAATLDLATAPAEGDPLPPGWHWLFFNPVARHRALDVDGHPRRGGFLPPIDLPRRMWAGSRIAYHVPLTVGRTVSRRSRILEIREKTGRGGRLCFVTVEHVYTMKGRDCVVEQQDIVYREAASIASVPAPPATAPPEPPPQAARWSEEFRADTTLLFRYSALTFNGHRIHYDNDYARAAEGYPGLVVHGPLTATLLQGFATRIEPHRPLSSFDFRGVAPLFVDAPFQLEADRGPEDSLVLRAVDLHGRMAMEATARFDIGARG